MPSTDSDALQRAKQHIRSHNRFFTREINLSGFKLSTEEFTQLIPELTRFKILRMLDLENNQLNSVPREITQLKNLRHILLGNNKFTEFPRELTELTNLISLNLDSNKLTTLHHSIDRLTKLKFLALTNNKLTTFPQEIIALKKIKMLYLDKNQLETLPQEIEQLTELNALGLNYNKLNTFPEAIIQLKKLKALYLGYNRLETLPPEIEQLKNLRVLNLSNNKLKSLPSEIRRLKKLLMLGLSNNLLTTFPLEIISLIKLRTLAFENNQITEVPEEIAELRKLQRILIKRNPLSKESQTFLLSAFPEENGKKVFLESESLKILKTLYPSKNEQEILEMDSLIGALYQRTGFKDGRVPSNTLNGSEVIDDFSKRIIDDETDRGTEITEYYHQAAKHLIEQALVEDQQTADATLVTIASSLGNCPAPANDLLEKTAVGIVIDQGGEITITLATIIHRQAFEHEIKKAKIPLGVDPAEAMNALTNSLFFAGSETYPKNPIKIVGERRRLTPKNESRVIDYAFNLIDKPEIIDAFAKLCCQTNQKGDLIVNKKKQYAFDFYKYRVITEHYMAGLGIFSKRETANANYRRQIETLVPKNFSTEYFDNEDVKSLINFPSLEQKHRETIARVTSDKINETAKKFLKDYKTQVKNVQQQLDSIAPSLEGYEKKGTAVHNETTQQRRRRSNSADSNNNRRKQHSV